MIFGKVFFTLLWCKILTQNYVPPPDVYLSITQLITKNGYPVEVHEVTTEDGYIITIHRIPHGKTDNITNSKPLILMTGIFSSSEHLVLENADNSSFAYYFADRGFDVWLANTRGAKYGRRHLYLDVRNSNFWNFSWHEIGYYDLPAIVDHTLEISGREKVYYSGHSQGGTIFYVLNSLRPEYQKKFAFACLCAPNAFSKHSDSYIVKPLANNYEIFSRLIKIFDLYEFPPSSVDIPEVVTQFCYEGYYNEICEHFSINILRDDRNIIDLTLLPSVLVRMTSVATKQLMHYAQCLKSRHFRPWDYGSKKNMEIYGHPEPPDYPVENIKVPTVLLYSMNDIFVFEQDVKDICEKMPGCIGTYSMPNPHWSHIDFLFAKDLEEQLLPLLLKYMNDFKGLSNYEPMFV